MFSLSFGLDRLGDDEEDEKEECKRFPLRMNLILKDLQQKYLFSQQQLVSLLSTTTIGVFVIQNNKWYLCYPQQQMVSLLYTTTIGIFVIHNNSWQLCYPQQQLVSLLSTTIIGYLKQQSSSTTSSTTGSTTTSGSLLPAVILSPVGFRAQKRNT